MGKTYRSLQLWNQWLMQSKGQNILQLERNTLKSFSEGLTRGKHGVLIGVPEQQKLLTDCRLMHPVLVTPLKHSVPEMCLVESDPAELPIASGSADLVLLPHTLEYTSRPHHLLAEACRIVRPEGHIVVQGFNPFGLWGLKKLFLRGAAVPLKATFLSPQKIKKWLNLSDFVLVRQAFFQPFGSIYTLVAEARVTPCTPIRLRWKQKLPAFRVTLAGPSIRNQVY